MTVMFSKCSSQHKHNVNVLRMNNVTKNTVVLQSGLGMKLLIQCPDTTDVDSAGLELNQSLDAHR